MKRVRISSTLFSEALVQWVHGFPPWQIHEYMLSTLANFWISVVSFLSGHIYKNAQWNFITEIIDRKL